MINDPDDISAHRDYVITRYQFLWENTEQTVPRKGRLTMFTGNPMTTATFRNTVLGKNVMNWYLVLLPWMLVAYFAGSVAFRGWHFSWVYVLTFALAGFTSLMSWEMYNRFRSLVTDMKLRNLIFEPADTWNEDVMNLTGDRRKYVHGLLGVRSLLLAIIKGTSLDIDLEQEDQEISYMVHKLIHMEELDSAIIKKAQNYVMRLQELGEENMETMEFLLAMQREGAEDAQQKEAEEIRQEQRKLFSRKYLTYKPPHDLYKEFESTS